MNVKHALSCLVVTLLIIGCSDDSSSQAPNTIPTPNIEDLINTKEVLRETESKYYHGPYFSNAMITSNNKFMYAMEEKGNDNTASMVYYIFNQLTGEYEFKGNALADDLDFGSNRDNSNKNGFRTFRISPDDKHIYVTTDLNIYILGIDSNAGSLSLLFSINKIDIDASGLFSPDMIEIDPLGKFVYVTAIYGGHIAVFARDTNTGELALSSVDTNTYGSEKITSSNDGVYLYSASGDYISVMQKNSTTGSLTLVQQYRKTIERFNAFVGFDRISDIDVMKDNKSLLVYGHLIFNPTGNALEKRWGIAVFKIDSATGEISYDKHILPEDNIYFSSFTSSPFRSGKIIQNPLTDFIYLLTEYTNYGRASTYKLYKVNNDPLSIDFLLAGESNLDLLGDYTGAFSAVINSDGNALYISRPNGDFMFNEGHIVQVELNSGNDMQTQLTTTYTDRSEGLLNASKLSISPDNKHIYVIPPYPSILSYEIDVVTGDLKYLDTLNLDSNTLFKDIVYLYLEAESHVNNVNEAKSPIFTVNGEHLCLIYRYRKFESLYYGILCLDRNVTTGELSKSNLNNTGIYSLQEDGVTSQDVDTPTFYSTQLPVFKSHEMTISPDGKFIYVRGTTDNQHDALAILSVNQISGELNIVGILDLSIVGIGPEPTFSNDGEYLYLSNNYYEAIFIFKVDKLTGLLSLIDAIQNGGTDSGGNVVEGLISVSKLISSHDNKYLYVSSDQIFYPFWPELGDNTVALQVFNRDLSTGALEQLQVIKVGIEDDINADIFPSSVIGGGVRTMDISSDGTELYLVSQKQRTPYESVHRNGSSLDVYQINQDGTAKMVQRLNSGITGIGINDVKSIPNSNIVPVLNENSYDAGIGTYINLN